MNRVVRTLNGYFIQDEDGQGWTFHENRVPLDKPLDYITWEDYQMVDKPLTVKTNILCPKCNKPLIKDKHIVLTTYPCKYRYFCEECGWTGMGV